MIAAVATRLTENRGQIARTAFIIVAGVAVTILAAKIQVPFWPVPMTLHTLAVMAIAVVFGPRMAVSIFLGYLAAGAAGFPVFSGSPERGIGLAYMVGPTGGYLIGYLIASGLVGTLAAGRMVLGRFAAMLLGLAVTYACGAAWLALYVPTDKLFAFGVAPFIVGDLIKIILIAFATLLLPRPRGALQDSAQ